MSNADVEKLALEIRDAYSKCQLIPLPPSSRDQGFDMAAAYAVEAELVCLRTLSGRTTVGRKVGFANKAMWRRSKLDTLVWAHMYDDTVHYATNGAATFSLAGRYAPKIEPEIVFGLKSPLASGSADAASVLKVVEWLAVGIEIVDCVFPDWKFEPVDLVAAFGFHTGLVVGEPQAVELEKIPPLVEQLARFKLKLLKEGHLVEEGSGKNSLGSPALCLGELAGAIVRQSGVVPLAAGELISTGTLTTPQPVAAGETWRAEVEGMDLPGLTLRFES